MVFAFWWTKVYYPFHKFSNCVTMSYWIRCTMLSAEIRFCNVLHDNPPLYSLVKKVNTLFVFACTFLISSTLQNSYHLLKICFHFFECFFSILCWWLCITDDRDFIIDDYDYVCIIRFFMNTTCFCIYLA